MVRFVLCVMSVRWSRAYRFRFTERGLVLSLGRKVEYGGEYGSVLIAAEIACGAVFRMGSMAVRYH